jgi:glycosyltransferase involved in cell wall biosynthesis
VITGTFNAAATLPRAIESILAQTLAELELLVVDDGSTDETPEIVARYDDPRIRYLKLPHMGIARSLNRGVEEARADIVGIQDADDWSLPERFERTVELLESHPEIAAVGVQMREVDDDGNELTRRVPRVVGDVRPAIMQFNPAPNNCLTIRKSALAEIGGWDPRWYYNVDYDMLLRLAERHEVVNLGETLGVRTLSANNYCTGPRHERAQIAEGLQVRMAAMRRRGSLGGVGGLAKPTASLIAPRRIKAALRRRRGQAQ